MEKIKEWFEKSIVPWAKNLKREFVQECGQHPFALIAATVYVVGLIMSYRPDLTVKFIVKDCPTGTFIYLIAAVIDTIIVIRGGDTMTQWFRRQFPRTINYAILIGLCTLTWWLLGPVCAMFEIRGITEGHLGWGKTSK